MQRRYFVKVTAVTIALAAAGFVTQPAIAADTFKVGILHSLSGTMAISETALKETALMTIEEISSQGLQ
jgi:urea transport system substrate-binding protein